MKTTLLTEDQIWGSNSLEVMQVYGTQTGVTDLGIILGGQMDSSIKNFEGDRCGDIYTKSSIYQCIRIVNSWGDKDANVPNRRKDNVRPVLPSYETSKIRPSTTRALRLNGQSIQICEFGEYPQDIVSDKIHAKLESAYLSSQSAYLSSQLKTTGKSYTFDAVESSDYSRPFTPQKHQEYTLDGKKYIRILGKIGDNNSILSNGETVSHGKAYWVEVKPIEWLQDKSGVWVAKKALFSGIQFYSSTSYVGNFANTDMNKYLEKYFSNEMMPDRSYSQSYEETYEEMNSEVFEEVKTPRQPRKRQRRYGIQVVEDPMTVKDQIDFYVQNGKSFMLHGPSGVGKTARVEAIDPDLTAIPLWNGVLPEDVVGKVRYPNGETGLLEEDKQSGIWTAPDWYVELCKKCEKEPDKKHVLFIDEVTNARPTTQSLIFHITLKKSITPSKGKLPDNAVVVLAGNSKEESGAAYNMPEPLFRRMCGHIYLEANVPDWLEWGSEKSRKHPEDPERLNIHPLVSSFVGTYGHDVFYSSYDEENPQQWAMDPRGWEQVSDIIYDNKGVIRRELLESKMGKELAAHLLAYAQNPPLSLEEVINKEYSQQDIPQGNDAKLALTFSLRYVDDKHVGNVREFIRRYLGSENQAIFDSLWVGKNDERALQIATMQYITSTRS